MGWTHRTTAQADGNGTSLSIDLSATGVSNGDAVVVYIHTNAYIAGAPNEPTTITPPSGWVEEIAPALLGSETHTIAAYSRKWDGDSTTVTFTAGDGSDWDILCFIDTPDSGDFTSDANGVTQIAGSNGDNELTAPSINVSADSVAYAFAGMDRNMSGSPFTPDNSYVNTVEGVRRLSVASRREFPSPVSTGAVTWTTSAANDFDFGAHFSLKEVASASVTITDAGDEQFNDGESVTITGTGFGATQGTGRVVISPTDNIADGSAVNMSIETWGGDTSVTFTADRGSFDSGQQLYLFVENDSGDSNASGLAVKFSFQATGSLEAQSASVSGSGHMAIVGTAAFVAQSAQVSGSGTILRTISLQLTAATDRELRDETNTILANELGWVWEWYDDPDSTEGTRTDFGTFDTDANGEATLTVDTQLDSSQYGQLIVYHPSNPLIRGIYYLQVP